ncbi:MAG: T9SS type A sorting domain-containing protein, partial [Bacteroidota bacterium]
GQIDVSAFGATAPYVFSWTDVSGLPLSSNNPITNIGLGTYNMVITDDLGCTFNYTFNVSDCVGIEEQTDLNNYLIYPNPSQGVMKINHKVGISGTLIIFNQLGEVVFTDKINSAGNQTQLNTNLSSGIYMLHIQENSGNILTFPIEIAR